MQTLPLSILDEAGQAEARGQAMDKRPEAHALDDPFNGDRASFH